MQEGWCGGDHLILFDESEVAAVSERYAISALLPGYQIRACAGGTTSSFKTLQAALIPFQPSPWIRSTLRHSRSRQT